MLPKICARACQGSARSDQCITRSTAREHFLVSVASVFRHFLSLGLWRRRSPFSDRSLANRQLQHFCQKQGRTICAAKKSASFLTKTGNRNPALSHNPNKSDF